MKFLAALFLTLAAPSAFADIDDGNDVGSPDVRYISWCDHNRVMGEDDHGQVRVLGDCSRDRLACVQEERFAGPQRVVVASCKRR